MTVAVIGTGKIGELVLSGLLRAGWQASELLVTARRAERGQELAERSGVRVVDNLPAVAEAKVLATRFGLQAIDAVHEGDFGKMMALRGTDIIRVPLAEGTGELKTVPLSRYEEAEVFFGS